MGEEGGQAQRPIAGMAHRSARAYWVVSIVLGALLALKGVGAVGWIVLNWLLEPLSNFTPQAKTPPPEGPFGEMVFVGLSLIVWGIYVARRKRHGVCGIVLSAVIATVILAMGRTIPTGTTRWFEAVIGGVLLLMAAWCACLELWLRESSSNKGSAADV